MTTRNTNERAEFELLAKPLIKWLNENKNPHAAIIITPTSAEVLTGEIGLETNEFLVD